MEDEFKIYVEQLRNGIEKEIQEVYAPHFLDIHEGEELIFEKEVTLNGVAYLAEDELILDWNIEAEAIVPCSVCNQKVPVSIHLEHFYHAEPLVNIKSGVFNFKNLLREIILLEVPSFVECEGHCPRRKEIEKYLKQPSSQQDAPEGYQPFADLEWDQEK